MMHRAIILGLLLAACSTPDDNEKTAVEDDEVITLIDEENFEIFVCGEYEKFLPGFSEVPVDSVLKYYDLSYDGKSFSRFLKSNDELADGEPYCAFKKAESSREECFSILPKELGVGGGFRFCVDDGKTIHSVYLEE